jgi:hypothetical protein
MSSVRRGGGGGGNDKSASSREPSARQGANEKTDGQRLQLAKRAKVKRDDDATDGAIPVPRHTSIETGRTISLVPFYSFLLSFLLLKIDKRS